jgi:hypothetical protein
MSRFEQLASCAELSIVDAIQAARSAATMRQFLEWASRTARPGEGAPKVLQAIAKLASATWVDGTLYVDIGGDDYQTKISIFADYGFGIRERLLPLARLDVPFDEFVRAVRVAPRLIDPFKAEQLAGSLILTPPDVEAAPDSSERAIQSIPIEESSLTHEAITKPPPPVAEADTTTKPPPSIPEHSGIHTHPTVRRMVAVRPEALRSGNDD